MSCLEDIRPRKGYWKADKFMAGSPPMAAHREGRGLWVGALAPSAGAGGCGGRHRRILDAQKNRYKAIGRASFAPANQRLVARIFIGIGETFAIAGDEM
jgi:hypothetical protein